MEGAFEIPDGLLDDPDLAEIAERLPDGASEITLGRRVGTSGRTSAFVAGRSASAADLQLLGSRLLAFYGQHEHRKLTLASAQLEILDGFAGAEHLERRREYRAAHAEAQAIAAELADLRDREGARERDLDLLRFELSEIEAAAPDVAEEPSWRPSASGFATRRACGWPPAGRSRRSQGADEDGGAEPAARRRRDGPRGPGRRRRRAGRAGRARRSRWRSSWTTSGASCAPTSTASRPSRGAWRRSRSAWRRSTACSESTAGRSRRSSSTPSAAAARSSGCERGRAGEELEGRLSEAERTARRRWRRRWHRAPGGRRSSSRSRVAEELAGLAMDGATLEVALPSTRRLRARGRRERRAAGRNQPAGCRSRRFATQRRAASSPG